LSLEFSNSGYYKLFGVLFNGNTFLIGEDLSVRKLILAFVLFGVLSTGLACTAVDIQATDGSVIAGRTMEWAFEMNWTLVYYPKGTQYHLTAPNDMKLQPIPVTNKYALFGIGTALENNAMLEGQNAEGLSMSGNFLPGFTQYQVVTKKDKKYLSAMDVIKFVLGNFATVKEVKEKFPAYKVWGPKLKNLPINPTIHFLISDRSGDAIVIEFIDGDMRIFDKTAQVLTNSPNYDWHMLNLRNYLNLSNTSVGQVTTKNGAYVTQFGQGGGLLGIPGDYTPPSRFVKMTTLKHLSTPSKNANESVQLVGHILNNVDIPKGVVAEHAGKEALLDYTQWVAIKDISHNIFYFSDYDHRLSYVKIDLNTIFSQKKAFALPIEKLVYPSNDVTETFNR
jgi:penicillin V acylase-like amidase (Ntn superfamily)